MTIEYFPYQFAFFYEPSHLELSSNKLLLQLYNIMHNAFIGWSAYIMNGQMNVPRFHSTLHIAIYRVNNENKMFSFFWLYYM